MPARVTVPSSIAHFKLSPGFFAQKVETTIQSINPSKAFRRKITFSSNFPRKIETLTKPSRISPFSKAKSGLLSSAIVRIAIGSSLESRPDKAKYRKFV